MEPTCVPLSIDAGGTRLSAEQATRKVETRSELITRVDREAYAIPVASRSMPK
jgi:hypothetical protein